MPKCGYCDVAIADFDQFLTHQKRCDKQPKTVARPTPVGTAALGMLLHEARELLAETLELVRHRAAGLMKAEESFGGLVHDGAARTDARDPSTAFEKPY